MYGRGDQVLVRGAGGTEAVLRVWEVRSRGLVLCSERGYERLMAAEQAPLVGFANADIVGIYKTIAQSAAVRPQREERGSGYRWPCIPYTLGQSPAALP